MKIIRAGILYHPRVEAGQKIGQEMAEILRRLRVSTWLCSAWDTDEAKKQMDGTGLVLTVGGDGTILRAAQVVLPGEVPIAGINLGKLGFLTELGVAEIPDLLPRLLDGDTWIDERTMIMSESEAGTFHALNDVVIARGAVARTVDIAATIDGQPLTTYRADGVIVSSATGSTGYGLAAGGPIMHPQSRDFLLVPIVPHLGLGYPLVLPSSGVLTLRFTGANEAALCIDGHINVPMTAGGSVTVRPSEHHIRFLRVHPPGFYKTLEQKLRGTRQSELDRKG